MIGKEFGEIESIEEKSGTTRGRKWRRLAIAMNGRIFSTLDEELEKSIQENFKAGDNAEIEYETSGDFNNIKTIKPQEKGTVQVKAEKIKKEEFVDRDKERQVLIVRQSSLKEARAFIEFAITNRLVSLENDKQAIDLILNVAETFVEWVTS